MMFPELDDVIIICGLAFGVGLVVVGAHYLWLRLELRRRK